MITVKYDHKTELEPIPQPCLRTIYTSMYIYTSSEVAVHSLAESTNHSHMAEEADEPNILYIGIGCICARGLGLGQVGLCCLHPETEK